MSLEEIVRKATGASKFSIQPFANNPKFKAYLTIPEHICSYLEHFQANYEQEEVKKVLGVFYLWLKVVNDEINENGKTGQIFLNRFNDKNPKSYEGEVQASMILTDALRELTLPQHEKVLYTLTSLYRAALSEREAINMSELIERRRKTGAYIASTSLQIMLPYIETNPAFEEFFIRLGGFGILVDTSIDLGHDAKNRRLIFGHSLADRALLYSTTLREGISMLASYPFLFPDYFKISIIAARSAYDRARHKI